MALLFWAVPFLGFAPYDFGAWVGPWYRQILAEGQIGAFAEPFGNYTPPYLYLLSASTALDGLLSPLAVIKLLSTFGAAWVAFGIYTLLRAANAPDPAKAALWSMLLPTIIFNVPILAQADTFWVAPCLLAVAAAIRGNSLRMTVWAGVAVAFKAQAVFIAPFVMAYLLQRRAPLWYWAIPALIYAAAMTPAWLAGWPAGRLAGAGSFAHLFPPSGLYDEGRVRQQRRQLVASVQTDFP
ncbi:MAG TPA: hypothetical protein VFK50_07095 [Sphingomicrobium sp.]|nr:hypothetical protein [Sphingomicrobium sp.]